jgi:hypothetical protein
VKPLGIGAVAYRRGDMPERNPNLNAAGGWRVIT